MNCPYGSEVHTSEIRLVTPSENLSDEICWQHLIEYIDTHTYVPNDADIYIIELDKLN